MLKTGDAALGDGVTRHFFTLVMDKLHNGFELDIGKLQFPNLKLNVLGHTISLTSTSVRVIQRVGKYRM